MVIMDGEEGVTESIVELKGIKRPFRGLKALDMEGIVEQVLEMICVDSKEMKEKGMGEVE